MYPIFQIPTPPPGALRSAAALLLPSSGRIGWWDVRAPCQLDFTPLRLLVLLRCYVITPLCAPLLLHSSGALRRQCKNRSICLAAIKFRWAISAHH
jgi:hypothetical protein